MSIMYSMMGSSNEIDCDVKKWGTQIETQIGKNSFKRSICIREVQEELVDIQLQDVEGDFDIDVGLSIKKRCRKLLEVEKTSILASSVNLRNFQA